MKKLPGLVQPSNSYLLLVMQVGGDEITERSPKAIKRDFKTLGLWLQDQEHRLCFLQSHQWQGKALKGTGKLTWLTGGSETGAVGGILVSLRFTRHRAC